MSAGQSFRSADGLLGVATRLMYAAMLLAHESADKHCFKNLSKSGLRSTIRLRRFNIRFRRSSLNEWILDRHIGDDAHGAIATVWFSDRRPHTLHSSDYQSTAGSRNRSFDEGAGVCMKTMSWASRFLGCRGAIVTSYCCCTVRPTSSASRHLV